MSSFGCWVSGWAGKQLCLSSIKPSQCFVFIPTRLLLYRIEAGLLPGRAGNISPQAPETNRKMAFRMLNPALFSRGEGWVRSLEGVDGAGQLWMEPWPPGHGVDLFPLQFSLCCCRLCCLIIPISIKHGTKAGGASVFVPPREFVWANNSILSSLLVPGHCWIQQISLVRPVFGFNSFTKKLDRENLEHMGLTGFFLSQSSLAGAGGSAPPQNHGIVWVRKDPEDHPGPSPGGLDRGTHWSQCPWLWQKSQELNSPGNLLLPPLRSTQALPAHGAVLLWRQKTFAVKPCPHEKFLQGEISPKSPVRGH